MVLHLTLIALLPALVSAIPCVQFDTSANLYAFGGSSDVKLGQNTTWSSPTATTLSTSGRPPWTGNTTQCLLSQYNNAMYVFNSDSANPSDIYIYNFAADSWSKQTTSGAPSPLGNSRSSVILDHDTNEVYLIPGPGQNLYSLDLSTITNTANSSAIAWNNVESPSFSTTGYTVTAAQASNHIHYFGVPGTPAGSADLFVVHYSYFQPTAQAYPTLNNGSAFPDSAGQAFSIPQADFTVPYQMVFIPNDFSSSYVVTHWTDPSNYATTSDAPFSTSLINTTQILPAPTSHDSQSAYAASDTALVQIDTSGNIYYMLGAVQSNFDVGSSPTWTKMSYTLAGTGGSSSTTTSASGSTSATGSAASGSAKSSSTASGSKTASTSGSASASASAKASSASAVGRLDLLGFISSLIAAAVAAAYL